MIDIKNVTKHFQQGKHTTVALKNINLHIPKGKIFGVIGSSGAGKSTLIRIVNLLERPTSGEVLIDGVALTSLSRQKLNHERQKIGMIFQHFNLLSSRTAFDNIALPLELAGKSKQQINAKVSELLTLVGLADKADAYPANLSGGQKQRIAIARALASDPHILLCDEATSALDPATTQSILTLLEKINQTLGLTILLITHEMEVVKRICHDVAIISGGELIEKGSVGEVFAHPKTELAQEFINSTLDLSIPSDYHQKLVADSGQGSLPPLVRLKFTGASVDAPVISHIARDLGINISIINSHMDFAGGVKFGLMLAEFFGSAEDIEKAFIYLQQHHIQVEVLGYVA